MSMIEDLKKKHEEFMEGAKDYNSFDNMLNTISDFIPSFFSKNGEADGIRSMYKEIRESDNDLMIECVDVNKASHIYKEYVEGMTSFITEIGSKQFTAEESDLGEYHEKLGVAKEKDSDFINSIYGGTLNKPESMPIKEAVENIEYLIDFIPEIDSIHDKCVTLKDTYEGMDNNILNESLSMLYESVENYCYSTVSSIASTYHNIKKTLQDGPVQESTQETFKLF